MTSTRATLLFGVACTLSTFGSAAASRPVRAATQPSALAFTDGRAGVSLDGAWHVIVDPYDNGGLDYRSQPRPHGYFDDARPRDRSDLVEYDFSRSPTLQVPGDWNTQRADLLYYEGIIWYERRFDAALHPGRRAFVQFGAAAQRAAVWLNGKRLGEHEGGFTPFAFEVTGVVRPRDNSIVVKVDNARHGDALTRFSEEYQADLYRHQIAMLKKIPALRGLSPWILVDFRTPRRPLPGVQDGWNRKGLVGEDGTKKQAFDVLRDAYRAWPALAPAAAAAR